MGKQFLIETILPIKELSEEATRERHIRHGHISTVHLWWARRPLVVSRAAVLGALLTEDERVSKDFIVNLCKWEAHDGDPFGHYLLERARALIRKRFGSQPPKVLDSFAGGGSIPLEALRLGCEAYALEYNPVAYIILKAALEYPQRYGVELASEVRRWGEWVLEQARRELAAFYPSVGGETPIVYIWSRTIRCPNPDCGAEIPLFYLFGLAIRDDRKVALKPIPNRVAKRVDFTIVDGNSLDFDPSKGTVKRGNAVCLICNTSIDVQYVRAEAQAGRMGHRLVAVVTTSTRGKGQWRNFRLATEEDIEAFRNAEQALQALMQTPSPWAFNLSWVPNEPSPGMIGAGHRPSYGVTTFGDFFNPRQLLSLCTFGKWVREAHQRILAETDDPEFAKAVTTYLAMAVDFVASYNSILSGWRQAGSGMRNTFAGHHLRMVWDYAETNPLECDGGGGWSTAIEWFDRYISRESSISHVGSVHLGSAADLPFPNEYFDAVITDPPYMGNVPYADLSDFFYVWLRRTIGDLYPEVFECELTSKSEEAIVYPSRFGKRAVDHYRDLLQRSFGEIHRVLKPEGVLVVMFNHRSAEGWASFIQSLLDAGFYPTAALPVYTEMETSTHQRGTAALRTTILIACRRRPEDLPIGEYEHVRSELEQLIKTRLNEFWVAGIVGADLFVSAISLSTSVFGQFREVRYSDGRKMSIGDLFNEVQDIVASLALEQMNSLDLDASTRFYVLYRWAYGNKELEYDEANKLAENVGANLSALVEEQRLLKRSGNVVVLLPFSKRWQDETCQKRWVQALENRMIVQLPKIDQIHIALNLWRQGDMRNLVEFLHQADIYNETHSFWRLVQILSDVERKKQSASLIEELRALEQLLANRQSILRRLAERKFTASEQLFLF